jgi:hypothetical protein
VTMSPSTVTMGDDLRRPCLGAHRHRGSGTSSVSHWLPWLAVRFLAGHGLSTLIMDICTWTFGSWPPRASWGSFTRPCPSAASTSPCLADNRLHRS